MVQISPRYARRNDNDKGFQTLSESFERDLFIDSLAGSLYPLHHRRAERVVNLEKPGGYR